MKPNTTAKHTADNGQQNGQQKLPIISDQEKNLFAQIADAALKAGGWQVLDAVNYWKNKIETL